MKARSLVLAAGLAGFVVGGSGWVLVHGSATEGTAGAAKPAALSDERLRALEDFEFYGEKMKAAMPEGASLRNGRFDFDAKVFSYIMRFEAVDLSTIDDAVVDEAVDQLMIGLCADLPDMWLSQQGFTMRFDIENFDRSTFRSVSINEALCVERAKVLTK